MIIHEQLFTVRGGRLSCGHRSHYMMGYGVAERCYGAVGLAIAKTFISPSIGFISHTNGAVEGRVGIPVPGVMQVKYLTRIVGPSIPVEGIGITLANRLGPAGRGIGVVGIHRDGIGRKEILFGLTVVVHPDLRAPSPHFTRRNSRLFLREAEAVAVAVDVIVRIAGRHQPVALVLSGVGIGRTAWTNFHGFHPDHVTLMRIGIVSRIDHDD